MVKEEPSMSSSQPSPQLSVQAISAAVAGALSPLLQIQYQSATTNAI